ncbi:ATP-binding protein [Galactobacter sp.]|uniref:ATP-binding protein n=1 Tax=Galactobacter sp. TaxID=2676125 RepID=UPI0025B85721|nr:ATP-binding protein [Galactobacter sp.]
MAVIVALVGAVGVVHAVQDAQRTAERNIATEADTIRRLPTVIEAMGHDDPHEEIQPIVDAALAGSDFRYITVVDVKGVRVAHVDPGKVGLPVSSDHSDVLRGQEFRGVEEGSQGVTYRVKLPILTSDGDIVGTVSVGSLVSDIRKNALAQSLPIAIASLVALGLGAVVAVFITRWLLRRFRKADQRLQEERAAADLLRIEAHEFENRMHLVSGLIELGKYDEARSYLDATPEAESEENIAEPMVQALVTAHSGVAAREHVALTLGPGTAVSADWPVNDDDLLVIANLISNAVEATGFGGTVWLLIEESGEDALHIRVEDDGPGFQHDDEDLIHRGFTTKSDGFRHGIGLASVTRVVTERGGRIDFGSSERGGGAQVDVVLPRGGADGVVQHQASEESDET